MNGRVALQDLELNQNDDDEDDSNVSNDSFVPGEEYEKESNNELKFDRGPTNEKPTQIKRRL